uniref:7TM_GPCR_Srx domain-containing protein n=1 Tax=Caenorhabditis tropicalis TaxID=1561998 RepID=A0A1I7TWG9_9PELO
MDDYKYYKIRTGIAKLALASALFASLNFYCLLSINSDVKINNNTCSDDPEFYENIHKVVTMKTQILVYNSIIFLLDFTLIGFIVYSLIRSMATMFVFHVVAIFTAVTTFFHIVMLGAMFQNRAGIYNGSGMSSCPLSARVKSNSTEIERCVVISITNFLMIIGLIKLVTDLYKILSEANLQQNRHIIHEIFRMETPPLPNREPERNGYEEIDALGLPPSYEEAMRLGRVSLRQLESQIERREQAENSERTDEVVDPQATAEERPEQGIEGEENQDETVNKKEDKSNNTSEQEGKPEE